MRFSRSSIEPSVVHEPENRRVSVNRTRGSTSSTSSMRRCYRNASWCMCMTMEGDMAVPLSPFIEAHHLRKGRSAKAPRMHAIGDRRRRTADLTTGRISRLHGGQKIRPESQKANGSIRNSRPYLVRRGGTGRSLSGPRHAGISSVSSVSIERTRTRESSQYEGNGCRSESQHQREALGHVVPCRAEHFWWAHRAEHEPGKEKASRR